MERGVFKEDVTVLFLWILLKSSESCGGLSWEDLLEKPEDLSDCEPGTRMEVPVVLDVLVSPSSVVTEFCDGFSCCPDWEFVEPQSFSFSKKACTLLYSYAGRDEVRKLTSESASTMKEKNEAVHVSAKFEFFVWRGAGAFRGCGVQEKGRSLQEPNSTWKKEEV